MKTVWATVFLAALLWFVTFYLSWSNFWIKISLSAAALAVLSMMIEPPVRGQFQLDARAVGLGIASAVLLYFIFWLGKSVSAVLFSFAGQQIGAIYGKGEGVPLGLVFFLLLLVTGPAEEIYWRGFLQRRLAKRFGPTRGWLIATAIYAGVHIWSFNFMLIGAAAVAGAFWGLCYMRWQRLAPVIVSHSLWSAFVFAVVPIP